MGGGQATARLILLRQKRFSVSPVAKQKDSLCSCEPAALGRDRTFALIFSSAALTAVSNERRPKSSEANLAKSTTIRLIDPRVWVEPHLTKAGPALMTTDVASRPFSDTLSTLQYLGYHVLCEAKHGLKEFSIIRHAADDVFGVLIFILAVLVGFRWCLGSGRPVCSIVAVWIFQFFVCRPRVSS